VRIVRDGEGFKQTYTIAGKEQVTQLPRCRHDLRAALAPQLLAASGKAEVGLVELPRSHAFASARLTDNVVQFTTRRYAENPLVVQGPGAGPEVTAAGVFADVLRIGASLGARL
jgi:hypothetical protein